jgi:ATP:ADP antiporter, AAA family
MRSSPNLLKTLLNIQAGEGQITALMFAYSFMWGVTSVTFNTSAYTIFLTVFDASVMSYFYIAAAVLMTLSGFLYNRLSQRIAPPRLASISTGVLAISILAIWLGLSTTQPRWLVFLALIWNWVLWTINGLVFWGMAGRLFNLLQGKRLYGFIGAGEVISGLVIGLLLPVLIPVIGTTSILLIAAVGFVGVSAMVSIIGRRYRVRLTGVPEADTPRSKRSSKPWARTNSYIVWIMALAAIAIVGFYLVDYLFYSQVEVVYTDEAALASFLATFVGGSRLVNLIVRTVLSGRLLSRFGLRIGLLMLPALLLIGMIAAAVSGLLAPTLIVFAVFVIVSKAADEVLRYTIDYPSYMILFQPLPTEQRASALSFSEGVISPASGGIAGVILIALVTLLGMPPERVAIVAGLVLVLWVVTALIAYRGYGQALRTAVANRLLVGTPELIEDRGNRDVIMKLLDSQWPGEVIYAVDLLCQVEDDSLPEVLARLLTHPESEVREDVLARIERLGLHALAPMVQHSAQHDASPRVRAAAIRTWIALGETDVVEHISEYLDADDPIIRLSAIVGLLRNGGLEGTLIGGERLVSMARSEDSGDRALAAQILGSVGVKGFFRPLLPLLEDPDPTVRMRAIKSAGMIQHPRLWGPVVARLEQSAYASAAASALAQIGEPVTPELAAYFAEPVSPQTKVRIIRVAGQIGGAQAADFLLNHINDTDRTLRTEALAALVRARRRAPLADSSRVSAQIEHEVRDAAMIIASLNDVSDTPVTALLNRALHRELDMVRLRLISLMSLLYDPELLIRIRESLELPDEDRQAYAIELLETLLPPDLRLIVLPVLRRIPSTEALRALAAFSTQPSMSTDQRIVSLLNTDNDWLTTWAHTCAIFTLARLESKVQSSTLIRMLDQPEPMIRETALWALSKLAPAQAAQYSTLMAGTFNEVKQTLSTRAQKGTGGTEMLLTIEKVSILKSVSIFDGIPEDMLAQLAGLLESQDAQAGDRIIERDEIGSEMYIIVTGRLRVHIGDDTLAELSERDIFGEMSLLDPGPRSASVTALTDTHLLKLDRDVLAELMVEHVEVSQAIIRVLTNRLRTAVNLLNESQRQLARGQDADIWGDLITNETGTHKRAQRTDA